jgi:outer membrane protein assembly factor BamB
LALLTLASAVGAATPRWSMNVGGPVRVPPTAADVNGDGKPEVIVCARFIGAVTVLKPDGAALWTFHSPEEITGSPAAADLNHDGRAEVVTADRAGFVTCLGGDGKPLWRCRLPSGVHYCSPVLADLDGDGRFEIVVGTSRGEVVCLSDAGKILWTFHLPTDEWRVWSMIATSLACGDVDGDGRDEVLVPSQVAGFYCLSSSGSVKWKFDVPEHCDSDPVIADLDRDGAAEVIAGWKDENLRCLDGRSGAERWRLAIPGDGALCALADLDGDGRLEIVAAAGDSIIAADASGKQLWRRDGVSSSATPVIGDFDGDGKPDVIVPCSDGRVLILSAEGKDIASLSVPGGAGGVVLADLDGDRKPEIGRAHV